MAPFPSHSNASLPFLLPFQAIRGERSLHGVPLVRLGGELAVRGVRPRAGSGPLAIEATFSNSAATASRTFAPLLVITDELGAEIGETTFEARRLGAGESASVTLRPDMTRIAPGTYYISVIPSHPDTGRSIGIGQYHVELKL